MNLSNNNFKDDFEKNRQSIDPNEHLDKTNESVDASVDNAKEEVSDKTMSNSLQEMLKEDNVDEIQQQIKIKGNNLINNKSNNLIKNNTLMTKTNHHQTLISHKIMMIIHETIISIKKLLMNNIVTINMTNQITT